RPEFQIRTPGRPSGPRPLVLRPRSGSPLTPRRLGANVYRIRGLRASAHGTRVADDQVRVGGHGVLQRAQYGSDVRQYSELLLLLLLLLQLGLRLVYRLGDGQAVAGHGPVVLQLDNLVGLRGDDAIQGRI